jgi:hypothetical protein
MARQHRQLETVQRWMQAVITHPAGVEAGLASDEARREIDVPPDELEAFIHRSRALTSAERLAVYANAYFARLLECMREMFPVLLHAVGEDLFDQFALEYLQRYPSRSYTLGRLADRFASYLEETSPRCDAEAPSSADPSWAAFVVDLARLEWTIEQVFDGPGMENVEPLSAADLAAVPAAQWDAARLVTAPCLVLLATRFPLNDYYTAAREGKDPSPPAPAESFMAVSRRDFVVRRYPLSRPQHDLLAGLAAGEPLGRALADMAQRHGYAGDWQASLRSWFRLWGAEGFFLRVELASP